MRIDESPARVVEGPAEVDEPKEVVKHDAGTVERPKTPFVRALLEAHQYDQRRQTTAGAPIDRWPMMAYHQVQTIPAKQEPVATESIRVGGQDAWAHDPGHSYGSFQTFDALQVDGFPERPVHVLLPRGWNDDPSRRFPVVYMNDGQNVFWPGGPGGSWFVPETLSKLKASGRINDVIVVGLEALNRAPEYTYIRRPAGVLRVQDYTKYLANHVKPFVDANYPTITDASRTTIVGSSHGGLAAFFTATRRPNVFGNAICMSSSFWHGLDKGAKGGPLRDSRLIQPITKVLADPATRPALWIDWGLVRTGGAHNSDIERLATKRSEEMVDLLGATFGYTQGADLFAFEDPEGAHNEGSWSRRFAGAMETFYGRSTAID